MDKTRVSIMAIKAIAAALSAALASGCASSLPPPAVERVQLQASATPPALHIAGLPGGKGVGAAVGAGTGSGAGAAAGAAMCLASGPLFPLCVLAVLPTTALIGAASGGIVGAIRTESPEAIQQRTDALKNELVATPYSALLAERLAETLREGSDVQVVELGETPHDGAQAPWSMDVSIVEVGTEGKRDFALRLVASVALRRGSELPVWQARREVQSESELTTDGWTANDAKALRGVLDLCIRQAARRLASELTRSADTRRPQTRYSSSCNDVARDWEPRDAS